MGENTNTAGISGVRQSGQQKITESAKGSCINLVFFFSFSLFSLSIVCMWLIRDACSIRKRELCNTLLSVFFFFFFFFFFFLFFVFFSSFSKVYLSVSDES